MRPNTLDPQLVLKVTPPRLPKNLLARKRLGADSEEFRDKSVISVHAPGGFGKTSLLGQWRREWLSRGAVVAWLTLDERDDGVRFAQGLAAAMSAASGRSSFGGTVAPWIGQGDNELEGLTAWLAAVADMGVDVVVILDDGHVLPAATAHGSLVYLLRNAPANLKVIVSSRGRIGLPVSDLLAHGQYAAVTVDTLRFTLDETLAVLSARFGSRIDADSSARLHELTDGWSLGLQLAISTIENNPNLRDSITAMSASSGDIQRYFVESLVAGLPVTLADFLMRISAVDAVHPALCQAITGCEDSTQRLAQLLSATPILLEGVDSEWMHIHPLAREFLKSRFDALPVDERRSLHQRGANWLADRQLFEEAARHALMAGQSEFAFELAERCLYDVLMRGQVARVLEWVERLPVEEVERRPRIRLAAAWALAMGDRHTEAAHLVSYILDDPAADDADRREGAAIAAGAAYFADQVDRALQIASPWLEVIPEGTVLLRRILGNQHAILALHRGAPEQARYHYLRAGNSELAPGQDFVRAWGEWVVGLSYFWEGQVVLAEGVLREPLRHAEEHIGRRTPIAVMLATLLAAVSWERDQPQEASALLAHRLDVLDHVAAPESIMMGYLTAARVALHEGQDGRSRDLLEGLYVLGDVRRIPRFRVASLTEQIRMHSSRSRSETCAALLARLEAILPKEAKKGEGLLGPLMAIQVSLARAYTAIAQRDWDRVLIVLKDAGAKAERFRRGREGVEIKLLRALAMKRCGDDGKPLLGEAISLAESYGLKRMLVDSHPDLLDWVRSTQSTDGNVGMLPERRHSLTHAAPPPAAISGQPSSRLMPSGLLTAKEREVLQLLARSMSNKQIALALGVSDETVKWHLKNLFGKLNAGTRKHVVDRARMLGVLESTA